MKRPSCGGTFTAVSWPGRGRASGSGGGSSGCARRAGGKEADMAEDEAPFLRRD